MNAAFRSTPSSRHFTASSRFLRLSHSDIRIEIRDRYECETRVLFADLPVVIDPRGLPIRLLSPTASDRMIAR